MQPTHPEHLWLSDYKPGVPVDAWINALFLDDTRRLDEVARAVPLSTEAQDELRKILFQMPWSAELETALDRLFPRISWPEDWISSIFGFYSGNVSYRVMENFPSLLDWWCQSRDGHDPQGALDHAMDKLLAVCLDNRSQTSPNATKVWRLIAQLSEKIPGWTQALGLRGRWGGLVLSACHPPPHDPTQDWKAEDYMVAFRCLINQGGAADQLWGLDQPVHLARHHWDRWQAWLNADPVRRLAWVGLIEDDRQVMAIEREWLDTLLGGKTSGMSLLDWVRSDTAEFPDLIDHAYFGELRSSLDIPEHLWKTLKNVLRCETGDFEKMGREHVRRVVVKWIVNYMRETPATNQQAALFLESPAARHLAHAPGLLEAGLKHSAKWLPELIFQTPSGMKDLLESMNDDHRTYTMALDALSEEDIAGMLDTSPGTARTWKNQSGGNLLQAWYVQRRPNFLKAIPLEKISYLAPEWLTTPLPNRSRLTLLDVPVNDVERGAKIRQRLLKAQIEMACQQLACKPEHREM